MPLTDFVDQELEWKQPHMLDQKYELRRDDRVLGTLEFRGLWGSFATAEIDGERWTFKREGFLRTRVTVRPGGSEADIAVFHNATWSGGGTLVLSNGNRYQADTNLWRTRYGFVDSSDRPITQYTSSQVLRLNGTMVLLPDADGLPELPWLAMLGWYLVVMMHKDDAASSSMVIMSS